jgi:tetratricopeptide (TPR) repeat protein
MTARHRPGARGGASPVLGRTFRIECALLLGLASPATWGQEPASQAPQSGTVAPSKAASAATTTILPPLHAPAQEEETLRSAAPTAGGEGELTGIEAAEVDVLKRWFQRRRAIEEGNASAAAEAVRQMEAKMDREGIRGMETLAAAFAHEAFDHLETGNYLAAQESFELALRFDPGLPAAHSGLAESRRLAGQGFGPYLSGKLAGVRAAAGNFWWTYIALANQSLVSCAAMALTAAILAALFFARHQRAWRHDIAEWLLARGASDTAAKIGACGVVLLPTFFWISGPWLLLFWLVGIFRYQRAIERAVTVALLAFATLIGPGVSFLLSAYRVTDSDIMRATVAALKGGYEPEKVRYIQRALQAQPDNPTFHFLLASVLKDGGYFVEAFQHYKQVLNLEADNVRVYNNVGNIYFATGQFGQAVSWYRKAMELDANFAIAYFNANLAQKELFHFTEAGTSLDRARSLAPDAVAGFLARVGEAAASPVDAKIPMSEAWFQVVRGEGGSDAPGEDAPRHAWLSYSVSVAAAAALGACLLLAVGWRRSAPAQDCPRCGRPFCSRCRTEGTGSVDFCPQCTHLFVNRGEVAPEARQQKQQQIARYERWTAMVRRTGSMLLPGSGHALGGRPLWGAFLLLGWTLACAEIWLRPRLLGFVGEPHLQGDRVRLWIGGSLLALLLVLANVVRADRRRPLPL